MLVTNPPAKWLTPDEAFVLYRVRRQIELVFKCHKSDGGPACSQARRGAPRLVELWAKWLARVLEHWVLLRQGGPLAPQSWRRRARRLRHGVPQLALSVRRSAKQLRATFHTILTTRGSPSNHRAESTPAPENCS